MRGRFDINEKRLEYSKRGVERIVKAGGHHAVVILPISKHLRYEHSSGCPPLSG
jgi:hypothetical protein